MSAKQLNPAYDGMTDQQVKRFKYWEFRTMAMCIFGYALFYFVRKNLSIAMPYLNEEMGISKSDLGLFLTLHGLIYGLSKFFNGIWGDRSNARYFLVTGLVFCGICNLLFGFSSSVLALGIFWIKDIYPFMAKWILKLPNRAGKILTWVLSIFLAVNCLVSAAAVYRWSERLHDEPPKTWIGSVMDTRFPNERMERIYANMNFGDSE